MNTGSPPISTTSASATGRSGSGAVTPKLIPASLSMSSGRPVKVITGCSASGSAPAADDRIEHPEAVAAAGVRDQAALDGGSGRGQAGHQAGQHVIGNGHQDKVGGRHHLGRMPDRDAGQALLDPPDGRIGHGRDGDDLMTRAAERDRERGPHPAGADDTHPQPGRVLARSGGLSAFMSFQSSPVPDSDAQHIHCASSRSRDGARQQRSR